MNRSQVLKRVREVHDHCPHCGETSVLQMHHRKNRGMGGRPKNSLDRFDNFLRVCAWLNLQMESNPEVAAEAREMGWKLGNWDGFEMPYYDKVFSKWFRLTEDGRKIETTPPMYLI